ncbi:putative O-succinylbenzoate--CoA ligase [Rhodococcus sp. AW25M09]|nr:putative O-succinylbenzoate--CoA ligase [Rhodococcus sp. AW25M09]
MTSELLAARVARHSKRRDPAIVDAAIVDATGDISYRQLWDRVERTAASLVGMRRIAVLPTSDIGSLVVVLAAMHAGVSVVLLHRHLLPREFADAMAVCEPSVVVAHARQHARLRTWVSASERAENVLAPVDFETGDLATGIPGTVGTPSPNSELLVGITSGTTGPPKLFVRNQASWAATLDRSDALFDLGPGDRVSAPGTLDHTHFLYGALHALTRGATVDLRAPAIALAGSNAETAATHLYSVPTIAWDIVRSGAGSASVREVLSSAARWPEKGRAALAQALPHATMTHFYGASELSFVSYDRLDPDGYEVTGQLFGGVEVRITDDLLYVSSDMLFDGYLTRADQRESLTGGPVDGWMTVGDRGDLDDGRLTILGRSSDTIVRAGLTVELAPIEAALLAYRGCSRLESSVWPTIAPVKSRQPASL